MDTNKKWVFLFLIAAIVIAVLSSLSGVQKKLSPLLDAQSRKVLAKTNSFYGVEQDQFLVLKIKDSEGIHIEVFQIEKATSAQTFKQKFDLFQDSDAYVTIDKNSTNLALSDVDKDGQLDILAPTVDRNGNLRLNTFRYNIDLKMFEPYLESNK